MHRPSLVLAVAFTLLVVAVAAAPAQALSLAQLAPAVETGSAVHPGDVMSTSVGGCTVSFAFDGVGELAGDVYMSTAAHCVASLGDAVSVAGTSGFATVAYIGNADVIADDFAFLRVAPEHAERVQGSVRGHPGTPTGVAASTQTGTGDLLLISGHGIGFSFTDVTRESRVGVLWSHGSDSYVMEAPIIFGDSGGPIVHDGTGGALGIVSSIVFGCCEGPGAWNQGPSVEAMLQKAAADGFTLTLRTA